MTDEAGRKLGGNRLIAHLVAAQRGFSERGKLGGTDQRHLAALCEIVDQLSGVFAFDGAPVPSTETRFVFELVQAGLIAGTVPTNGIL